MKQYVISVMIAGVIGAIVTLLSPEGEGGGLKNHVRLAVGLVLVTVSVSPIIGFVKDMSQLDVNSIIGEVGNSAKEEYESIFYEGYGAAEIENLKEGIKGILFERFGVKNDECYISVTTGEGQDGKRELKRIFINFYGAAIMKNTEEIEDYLSSLLGCEVVSAVG